MNFKLKRSFAVLTLIAGVILRLNAQTNDDTAVPDAAAGTNSDAAAVGDTNAPPPAAPVADPGAGTNAVAPVAEAPLTNNPPAAITNLAKAVPDYRPLTITVEAGLFSGIGAGVNWRFASHLGLRGGVDYFHYSKSDNAEFSGDEISAVADYTITLAGQSEYLALDLYPSRKSSFHISLGAVFEQSEYRAKAVPTEGTITIDGEEYNVQPGGNLRLKITRPDISPYVAIGGNFFLSRAKHWSMGFELGAAYGKWDVSLNSSGIDDPTGSLEGDLAEAQSDIKDALNKVPIWPIFKLNFSYAF